MSEINIEIDKEKAMRLLPQEQIVVKMLRNGKLGETTMESVKLLMKFAHQIGYNALGEAYRLGLSLWIKSDSGTVYIETVRDEVDHLSQSLGVDLPH